MNYLKLINRTEHLFKEDINNLDNELNKIVSSSRFLVIGAAGTIGQATVKEIFKRNPIKLHAVDLSENNLVELVRDLRSTYGYINGDFKTYAIDCGSREFETLLAKENEYDYILNLSALKHVRSEKDPYTLMRMIDVNIFNTIKTIKIAKNINTKKYFCVSTDKASNPVNMMGASKRIMELFLMKESSNFNISTARFANVAFSDGSLLHGFNQRFENKQPIAAPNDVRRYFVTKQESGELCLVSCLLGENRDILFPKLNEELDLITFSSIAKQFLSFYGYEPYECETEQEARAMSKDLISKKKWPCYFFKSDTTGEKDFEEFFTQNEDLDLERFIKIGVVKSSLNFSNDKLNFFVNEINKIRSSESWSKEEIVNLFKDVLPDFEHIEKGKNLDQKM
ncbi:MAG: UDP-N-acetylglucosamine 4,6-dehydratase [Candidatus Marinimicrobia bacterium]|nr:UDP-N-acetylglucosamine 4,6-dehydratase [Candidatus Neomarinimicrobiota bacterium]